MILYHTTSQLRAIAIKQEGLRVDCSQTTRRGIWLHSWLKGPWAYRHLSEHHGWKVSEMLTLRVTVSRSQVFRRRRGIWLACHDIPPSQISFRRHAFVIVTPDGLYRIARREDN